MNCIDQNHLEWSYNAGVYLYGAAVMWNVVSTGSATVPLSRTWRLIHLSKTEGAQRDEWRVRTQGLLDSAMTTFFNETIMTEVTCERTMNCNIDQQTFKAYLSRWMAASVKVAPWTHDTIMPLLASSAQAAARTVSKASVPEQNSPFRSL